MKKRWVFLYAVMVCMLLLGCAKKEEAFRIVLVGESEESYFFDEDTECQMTKDAEFFVDTEAERRKSVELFGETKTFEYRYSEEDAVGQYVKEIYSDADEELIFREDGRVIGFFSNEGKDIGLKDGCSETEMQTAVREIAKEHIPLEQYKLFLYTDIEVQEQDGVRSYSAEGFVLPQENETCVYTYVYCYMVADFPSLETFECVLDEEGKLLSYNMGLAGVFSGQEEPLSVSKDEAIRELTGFVEEKAKDDCALKSLEVTGQYFSVDAEGKPVILNIVELEFETEGRQYEELASLYIYP
ncbi:MAG: hypothetical protein Q4C48_04935 [Lachnospiraceae bacterium]|nr:hypothetical protein [Lachnospiraceae bacterium]